MDFISGIDRYSKMKPYGQERFGGSLAKENIRMGMVVGRRPGLVRYVVQTGMTNQWLKEQGLVSVKELWVHIHYGDCGPVGVMNRLVRPRRMLGGVGAGG
jgi:hypothetical protein